MLLYFAPIIAWDIQMLPPMMPSLLPPNYEHEALFCFFADFLSWLLITYLLFDGSVLVYPRMMDVAVSANMVLGLQAMKL